MPQSSKPQPSETQSSEARVRNEAEQAAKAKAADERREASVSQPGGFANDPDDPANPNEAIERSRRHVRP